MNEGFLTRIKWLFLSEEIYRAGPIKLVLIYGDFSIVKNLRLCCGLLHKWVQCKFPN